MSSLALSMVPPAPPKPHQKARTGHRASARVRVRAYGRTVHWGLGVWYGAREAKIHRTYYDNKSMQVSNIIFVVIVVTHRCTWRQLVGNLRCCSW